MQAGLRVDYELLSRGNAVDHEICLRINVSFDQCEGDGAEFVVTRRRTDRSHTRTVQSHIRTVRG